jgi:hypothetical protein
VRSLMSLLLLLLCPAAGRAASTAGQRSSILCVLRHLPSSRVRQGRGGAGRGRDRGSAS